MTDQTESGDPSDSGQTDETGFSSKTLSQTSPDLLPSYWHQLPWSATVSVIGLIVILQIVSFFVPPYVVPGWPAIIDSLLSLDYTFVWVTLLRVFVALILSFVFGLGGAILMYLVKPVEDFLLPIVKLIMAVPVICWIIFAILWFQGMEFRIGFILTIVCGPIFLVDSLDAMKNVSRDLRNMLRSFRPTRREMFTKLIIPATLPNLLTSWKINLSLAIRVVTIAELVGATSGIGYGLQLARQLFSVADVFAWTLILIVALMLAMGLVSLLEKRLLVWRQS